MRANVIENSATAIWERAIRPMKPDLEPAAARAILRLRFSRADLDRADELAEKARIGTLAAGEDRELEEYRTVGTTLEFLKSKARLSLKRPVE